MIYVAVVIFLFILGYAGWAHRKWAKEQNAKRKHFEMLKVTLTNQQVYLLRARAKVKGRYTNTFHNKRHRATQAMVDSLDHMQEYNQAWYNKVSEALR